MGKEPPLKSAYELAMERLRAKDREAGVEESRPLTRSQKDEIARIRQESEAKLAELEIMIRDKLAAAGGDPEKILEIKQHYEIDRGRVESSTESAIRKVREKSR